MHASGVVAVLPGQDIYAVVADVSDDYADVIDLRTVNASALGAILDESVLNLTVGLTGVDG